MNVLFLSPGFPQEMPQFVRALAEIGADVIGVGEQPVGALDERTRHSLSHYEQVPSLWDERDVIERMVRLAGHVPIDLVECLWEPGMILAARLREALELPGMGVEATLRFRDKERMKLALDAAGIRTPAHAGVRTERECREAAERIGYPLILKPIAGAGSADTHRVDSPSDLDRVLHAMRHVHEVSVEEFIDGEEYTFDTICARGEIRFFNVSWYRPRPLIGRTLEWTSPQTVSLRQPEVPHLMAGIEMGRAVIRTLGFTDGFSHMEWFLGRDGRPVFGEIAARPPGAVSVDIMNHACDGDTFVGWAEAVCRGHVSTPLERRFNAAVIFKRARGSGRIRAIHGLERLVARYRPHIVDVHLLPVGAPRRDWRKTLLSDGWVVVRHPDLDATCEMADRFGTDLVLEAE
jgi:hypothetical protein